MVTAGQFHAHAGVGLPVQHKKELRARLRVEALALFVGVLLVAPGPP